MSGNDDAPMNDSSIPMPSPTPTERDYENERIRRIIAEKQLAEYDAGLAWAIEVFGPGWLPSHKHFLIDKDEEDRVRYTHEKPQPAATVFRVRNVQGMKRHFTVQDGAALECDSYETGFGSMLFKPHPTRGFEHGGKWHFYHRYSLCFASFELYHPKSAEQLASLRASREKKKMEEEEKKWAEDHPLFALAWFKLEDFEDDQSR